ncbi:hypothetical protein ACQKWADRAFT_295278 [Trichoderma austrokoningii]
MSPKNPRPNPVFQELAEIQRDIDICPNPQDSNFETCRAKRKRGGRCRNPPCIKEERWHVPSLLLEFQNMTECPNTKSFHEKMEIFITYTHCKREHRSKVIDAFNEWKKERVAHESTSTPSTQLIKTSTTQPITAAVLRLLPSTPTRSIASSDCATSDDGSSFVDSIAEIRSVASNTTCMTSLPNTPLRNGTVSRFHIEDVAEEGCASEPAHEEGIITDDDGDEKFIREGVEQDVFEEAVKEETLGDDIIAGDIKQECNDSERIRSPVFNADKNSISSDGGESDEEGKDTAIKGLGIIGLQRTRSLRDHSPVFQVINSHPTEAKMQEGVVYILKHKKNASLFKIGWSSKGAEQRLKQPKNCYGINTEVFYETKRFIGAPQAERIAQVILRHVNIRVSECFECHGGHREWFVAPIKTVHDTVLYVEEFLQMPAYTLQDEVYKLSPEVYERVVKQMCDFSLSRFEELMHGPSAKSEEAKTLDDVLIDAKVLPLAQGTHEPVEVSLPNEIDGVLELHEARKSFASISPHDTKAENLSVGARLMRETKWLVFISDSVRAFFSDF